MHVDAPEAGVEDVAANVVEVHVDLVGAQLLQPPRDVVGLVVDRPVEPELAGEPRRLLVAAADADHAAAVDLGDLRGQRARRAGGRRHDDRLAGLGLADVEDADVGGEACGPVHRQQRRQVGVELERRRHAVVADDPVLLPARQPVGRLADRELLALRRDDHPDRGAAHRLADLDRREVALAPVEPRAHGRVDAHVLHLEQRLAVGDLGDRCLDELEVVVAHEALGPLLQDRSLPVDLPHGPEPTGPTGVERSETWPERPAERSEARAGTMGLTSSRRRLALLVRFSRVELSEIMHDDPAHPGSPRATPAARP